MNDRTMKEGESLAQFAHEIERWAKLANLGFEESALSTATRDAFIRRLPEELRLEIKKEREHVRHKGCRLADRGGKTTSYLAGVGKMVVVQATKAPLIVIQCQPMDTQQIIYLSCSRRSYKNTYHLYNTWQGGLRQGGVALRNG